MRRLSHASWVAALLLALTPPLAGLAQETSAGDELREAARTGDLERVRALLDEGVPVDAVNKYGSTALNLAAGAGQTAVVRLLLERGADVERAEEFYGATPLQAAFFNEQRETALVLLEAGAEGREQALDAALVTRDLELARAAVAGGPLHASSLAQARTRAFPYGEEWRDLLAAATPRPDPEPPVYDLETLHTFTGVFEGWTSDNRVEVALREGDLWARVNGEELGALAVTGESSFQAGEARMSFFGRAGTIEGLRLFGYGTPEMLRRSVAEPVGGTPVAAAAGEEDGPDEPVVHWPSFRGANGSGIGDGADAPVVFDVATGDNVRWQAELPGLGNSSPVVWGNRVFVTTAVAEDAKQEIQTGLSGSGRGVDESVEHSWRVLAFDKTTGAKLWETEVGRGVPPTRRHFTATQATSTPATDGQRLVAVFPTAGIACLDLDGEVLWKHDLGGLNAGAFTDPGQEWGFASSPVIHDGKAILQVDVHGGQYLAAWDLATGEQVWRTRRQVAPSWATPSVMPGPEGEELVVNASTIHGYDPDTGEELWSLGPNSELVIATPVIGDGVAYVSAGYPPVKPIYAIESGLRGDHETQPGKPHDGLLWSHRIGGAYMPTPLLYRGIFYVVHHNGRMVAYDALSGAAVYKERFSKGGTFTGSPVAVNGRLYVPTEEGRLYVVTAGSEYEELAVNEVGEPLMATPAVSEGTLFLRTPSRLVAVARTAPAAGEATAGGAPAPEDGPAGGR
ncbi:MAG: PQQ-binding-like beta-propeller repeat protein [Thermoanaerobaculia bacterium]|nr:PQQ-binding-like beta-propeller repeat protein [Thermoanaerobaculia bacterium]